MRFKKTITGLVVGGLLVTNGAFVFGATSTVTEVRVVGGAIGYNMEKENPTQPNAKMTEEEALKVGKSHIQEHFNLDVDEDGQNFQSNIHFREDWNRKGKYLWELGFHRHGRNEYLSVSVTIRDEDGKLTQIRKHQDNRSEENQIARYTRDEAEKIAHQFLLKSNKDILDQLILDPRFENVRYYGHTGNGLNPSEYYVYYTRQKDGIPVLHNGVQIGVNSGSGEVTSYSLNWSEEKLPDKKEVISEEEAKEVFKDNLKVELSYIPVRDTSRGYSDSVKEVKLAYSPRLDSGAWVDAATGKMVNYRGEPSEEPKKIDVTPEEKRAFQRLTSTRESRSKEMTREEAMTLATEVLNTIYDGEVFKIENANYSSSSIYGDGNRRKTWDIHFRFEDEPYANGHLSIDAMTEEVLQLNNYNWHMREMMMMSGDSFTPALTWEEGYYKAIEVIKALYPEKLKSLELEQTYHENIHYYNDRQIVNPEYYFYFARKENDIPFRDNQLQVSIDTSTGRVARAYSRWHDVALPPVRNLLTEEKALDVLMEQSEVRLSYVILGQPRENQGNEVKLVYSNQPMNSIMYSYIDAHTGSFLDWNGQQVKPEAGKNGSLEEKLKGHWAERELKIMAANGVLDLEKFDLTDEIIKNEIIKMMASAVGHWHYSMDEIGELKFTDVSPNDEYIEYLRGAVIHRFIDNEAVALKGYDTVSKEDFAEMLIKMTPLEKAAQAKEIYTMPVDDFDQISSDKQGAVALMYGLEVLKGEGDSYQPKEKVTLEDAAVAIYRTFKLFGRIIRW